MEKELQLEDLLAILKKNIVFIGIISIITSVAVFIVSSYFIEKKYQSSALIYVENNQKTSDSLNINDINAAQKLVTTCQVIFKSNTMMDNLINMLYLPYSKEELNSMITAQAVNNTEVMKITVTSTNRREAASIVNTMLDFAREEFNRIIKSGSFEVVDFGEVSEKPSFPNVKLFTVIGFIAGFALSYVLVFIKDIFDVVIKHEDDLTRIYNIPLFTEVPDFDAKINDKNYSYSYEYSDNNTREEKAPKVNERLRSNKRKSERKVYLLSNETPFAVTEAYNAGRTNIMFSAAPYDSKIIAFTSCNPKEGKSTTCINMSISFAKAGFKTLLIDCDMRKPVVNNYFDIKSKYGLSSVLGGFCSVGDSVTSEVVPNLDVIAVGDIPPNPSELLGSAAMTKLLEASVEIYDYIFLDTPPVNVVTDSQLMNHKIAGIVFIVRENSTTHPEVQKAVDKITLANGRALGFVKNFSMSGTKKYSKKYGKSYGYSYGYGYGNNAKVSDRKDNNNDTELSTL